MAPRTTKLRDLVIVVVGPRTITRKGPVLDVLERAHRHKPIGTIVHGATPGPELMAAQWASDKGIRAMCCAADWAALQEIAILDRNRRMIVDYCPDGVIIFPGAIFGEDLAARAGAAKIPVWWLRMANST
jgi:hypothetical protein